MGQRDAGAPKECHAFLALRIRNGLPHPTPQDQETSSQQRRTATQYAKLATIDALAASIPPPAIRSVFGNPAWTTRARTSVKGIRGRLPGECVGMIRDHRRSRRFARPADERP